MEKTGRRRIVITQPLLKVLPLLICSTSIASAVDISIFAEEECLGVGISYENVDPGLCAPGTGKSVLVKAVSCEQSTVYKGDPPCVALNTVASRFGNTCYSTPAEFTGASWDNQCATRRRRLSGVEPCDVNPTAVVYTETSTTGTWTLWVPNATDYLSHLMGLSSEGKVNWFKARGAEYSLPWPN